MHRTLTGRALAATALAALAAPLGLSAPAYAAQPLEWTATTTFDPETNFSFSDVVPFADDDVWAFGDSRPGTVAQHWDGRSWTPVKMPEGESVHDAHGLATDDVWAVGADFDAGPYAAHWDGESWTKTPLPAIPDTVMGPVLTGVHAAAPDDVWAVGEAYKWNDNPDGRPHFVPFVEHWDGESWTMTWLDIPKDATGVNPQRITVAEDGTVWASGMKRVPIPDRPGRAHPVPWLATYADGRWQEQALPELPLASGAIEDIESDTETGVWITGYLFEADETTTRPFLANFRDGAWTTVQLPQAEESRAMYGLAVDDEDGVFMVGIAGPWDGEQVPVAFRYDGETAVEVTPPGHKTPSFPTAVEFTPGSESLWSVGFRSPDDGSDRIMVGAAEYAELD